MMPQEENQHVSMARVSVTPVFFGVPIVVYLFVFPVIILPTWWTAAMIVPGMILMIRMRQGEYSYLPWLGAASRRVFPDLFCLRVKGLPKNFLRDLDEQAKVRDAIWITLPEESFNNLLVLSLKEYALIRNAVLLVDKGSSFEFKTTTKGMDFLPDSIEDTAHSKIEAGTGNEINNQESAIRRISLD